MTGQKSNIHNDIIIKSVKPRYININEDIFNSLSPRALKIYLALRFEADYSSKNSCVNKKIQFLINKTKISRSNVFESLNELEKFGLLLREQNKGYQSTFWIAQDLNYFNENKSAPVQNTDYPVQNTDYPVQNTDYIISNTSTNDSIKESITFSNTKENDNIRTKSTPMDSMPMDSIPMENDPHINKDNKNKENKNIKEKIYKKENDSEFVEVIEKAQECLDKTKENLPSAKSEIIPYDYQETNLPVKPKKSPIKVLQAMNTLSLSDEFLNDLIATRKANGGKVNPSALKSVYNELIKLKNAGFDLDECLSLYANCGWKGFVAEWCINAIEKKKKNPYDFYSSNDISWGEEMKNDPWYNGLLD